MAEFEIHSGVRSGPIMGCCTPRRPDFRHFDGFPLLMRWISRAIGLSQRAPGVPLVFSNPKMSLTEGRG